MIVDKFENFEKYHSSDLWRLILDFLMSLTSESEERKYILQGDDVFALVMSYKTKEPDAAKLEAHQQYIDIQAVLSGNEGFEWFSRKGLTIDEPYNEASDVVFLKRSSLGEARINLSPGRFIVFYPEDAHMPALTVNGQAECIKKVVVKVKTDLLMTLN